MKKTILSFGFAFLLITLYSCKDSTKVQSTDSQTGVETQLHEEEEEAIEKENRIADFFAENEGKYPRKDLDIFKNEELTNRIKKLVGDDFAEVYENFNTETPIVSVDGIYKFTGCKEHDCPSFFTTVLYDSNKDNLNVLIDKKGKIKVYDEKEKIVMTKSLRVK